MTDFSLDSFSSIKSIKGVFNLVLLAVYIVFLWYKSSLLCLLLPVSYQLGITASLAMKVKYS